MHEKTLGIAPVDANGAWEAEGSLLLSLVLEIESLTDSVRANSLSLELNVRDKLSETEGLELGLRGVSWIDMLDAT